MDTPTDAAPTRRLGNRYQTYYWAAAAIVVLLIGIGYAYRPIKPLSTPAAKEIASRTIHIQSTQDSVRVSFLPDSSRVWLN